MIHRAPFGSLERFVAYSSSTQPVASPSGSPPTKPLYSPISDKYNDYAQQVRERLEANDVRTLVDDRSEKIGRKIRDNEMKHIPYLLVVGEKEAADGTVAVRMQGSDGQQEVMTIDAFAARVDEEVKAQLGAY